MKSFYTMEKLLNKGVLHQLYPGWRGRIRPGSGIKPLEHRDNMRRLVTSQKVCGSNKKL